MKLFRQPSPQNLSAWLAIAIGKLVPSAQTRVGPEIEVHYAESVQAHVATGLPEAAAHTAALAELGDARAAARRFAREHLTWQDALAIDGLFIRSGRKYFACCIFLLFIYVPGYFRYPQDELTGMLVLFALISMSTPDIYFWPKRKILLPGGDPPMKLVRRVLGQHLLLNSITGGLVVLAFVLYYPDTSDGLSIAIPLMMVAALILAEWRLLRLRQKLRFHSQDRRTVIFGGPTIT